MKFTYRSKGTSDDWTEDTIEAQDKVQAQSKLDEIYGITRGKDGKQTNGDIVRVEIL